MKRFNTFKKAVLLFSGFLIISNYVSAQPWKLVGTPGFSPGSVYYTSMATDSNNVPYVAYQDAANSYGISAMTYNGTSWITMGSPGFSPANASSPSLFLSSKDTAFVAYIDGANGSRVSVMKYNGTNWVNVGAPDFSDSASMVSLALGLNDTAYVALIDDKDSSRVTVMKYNGVNWVNIGKPGFSTSSDDVSIAIDESTGIPYVAFTNTLGGGNVNVANYTGRWKKVGASNFSAGGAAYLSLVINKSSMPIVAYQDGANLNMASVMEYNGSGWVNLGTAGFSKGAANYTSLALDSAGVPFVAYQDAGNGSAATVAEYNGSNWLAVGSPGCTAGTADYTSLAIDRHGKLYVAFEDGSQSGYATVVTYQHCNTWNPVITASANGQDTICPGSMANISASGATAYAWSTGDSVPGIMPVLTDTNTVYRIYVTGIAANGCASTDSINVYTKAVPKVTVSGKDTICNGSMVTLTAGGATSYTWSTGATTSSVTVSPDTTIVYNVIGKGANGCIDSIKKSVTVNYGPVINIMASPDTICKGDSTTLRASGAISYVWTFDGSTSSSVIVKPVTDTKYLNLATGSNGCKSIDSITVYIDTSCTAGMNKIKFSGQFKLEPNPAHDYSYLQSNVLLSDAQLTVVNPMGQLVWQACINNLSAGSLYPIDLTMFKPGIYFLRLTTFNNTAVYKLVKE